ncbi:unnamed protein product [Lupinus luteus]|uniref:Uncharacterized protein n=1 Tax=Lupinus luteus TaxID=3873 RepID=A0AAV1WGH0_LUPLU
MRGITVGDTQLSIEKSIFEAGNDGSGGIIIDSSAEGLDLCFALPSDATQGEIPKLVSFQRW